MYLVQAGARFEDGCAIERLVSVPPYLDPTSRWEGVIHVTRLDRWRWLRCLTDRCVVQRVPFDDAVEIEVAKNLAALYLCLTYSLRFDSRFENRGGVPLFVFRPVYIDTRANKIHASPRRVRPPESLRSR